MSSKRANKIVFTALASGLAFLVVGGLLMIIGSRRWQMVHTPFVPSLVGGGIVVVALALLVVSKMAPGGRVRVFLLLMVYGEVAITIGVFGYLKTINAVFDGSEAQWHRANVIEIWKPSRGPRRIMLESWRAPGDVDHLEAPDDLDASVKEVLVNTRDGALGFEWVVSIKAVEP
ncbi:MAG TPA: hypothetical protein VFQ53_36755 [Kofleriaceae bacterium]|nr:hypothetical protein [Kofleriaceae bacterium]